MPELPEVETTRRGIAPSLTGQRILQVTVRERRLRWPLPRGFEAQVAGCRVGGVRRRAKYLLVDTDRGTLMIHLGMSGSLRICPAGTPWRRHDHLALVLDSGHHLRFHDPRRFGCWLWTAGDPLAHPLLHGLGPEPLGDGFTADHLARACKGRAASIKQAVMDARVVVGVGNIYACEALFAAGIDPRRPAGRVGKPRLARLVGAIRAVLQRSIGLGGTTLRDFLNESGQPGYFRQQLQVYGRAGQPCPACGAAIRRVTLGQRSTFYCQRCQR